ncbi:hypothetical protein [Sulfurimonas sp.]|uniref:hypothetical protein n=1 Tax=Sulfurimonas sp. TaxID=2022749 RepID=UPI003D0C9796
MYKHTQIFLVLVLIILSGCSRTNKLPAGSDMQKFDSIVWQNESSIKSKNNSISAREKMLKDLVENVLPNKTKNEIEDLLGKSLETVYFKSIDKDMVYYLGPQRDSFMNIDSEWLLIWLDDSGKFKDYRVVND